MHHLCCPLFCVSKNEKEFKDTEVKLSENNVFFIFVIKISFTEFCDTDLSKYLAVCFTSSLKKSE